MEPKQQDSKRKVRKLWKTEIFKNEENHVEKDMTYVKQPWLHQIDNILFKFEKPLHPRDILKSKGREWQQ